eukprot:630323-Pyramimonas_sp.AAC.1
MQDVRQVDVAAAANQNPHFRVACTHRRQGGENVGPRRHVTTRGRIARAKDKARAGRGGGARCFTPELQPLHAIR